LERGLSEAIQTDLLFGELELVAERTAKKTMVKKGKLLPSTKWEGLY
jgi:hypothetical protein